MGATSNIALQAEGVHGRVQVEFNLVGDFYSHSIWLLSGDERVRVFKSIDDMSFPNLPCFTLLQEQGQTLFLTGANGPCYWSMSVQVGEWFRKGTTPRSERTVFSFSERYGLNAPDRSSRRRDWDYEFLFFDVACRLNEQVPKIGCEYVASEIFDFACSSDRFGTASQSESLERTISYGAISRPGRFACKPNPKCFIECGQSTNLRFYSSHQQPDEYPATIQWSYGFWFL